MKKQKTKIIENLSDDLLKEDLNIKRETRHFNESFGLVEKIEIPIYYHYDENGEIIYDIEEMTTYFNNEISKLK